MSFDIVQTPTLHAVATQDEKQLADHLQKRVDEAISQAEAQPGAERAIAAHGTAGLGVLEEEGLAPTATVPQRASP
jgi:hypothetical protein